MSRAQYARPRSSFPRLSPLRASPRSPCPRPSRPWRPTAPWALATLVVALGAIRPASAGAQLISPGKLSHAHEQLDGIRNCTACHELGKPGISDARCLECHEPVKTRIDAGTGYHAHVAERSCGQCHKEHFGRDFDTVRLDTAAFHHEDAGYALLGSHARVSCRECHASERVQARDVLAFDGGPDYLERTLLGLPTDCASCHAPDDPHGGQFGSRGCEDCHDEGAWDRPARFDHDRAAYRLTGRHREVACGECHPTERSGAAARVSYVGLEFDGCASCHADPHAGSMGTTCTSCHATTGWHRLATSSFEGRFDHDRTSFPLAGGHADVECAACHGQPARRTAAIRIRYVGGTERFTYPRPLSRGCASCHVDAHGGEFRRSAGGGACEGCHAEAGWTPTTYGIERHNSDAGFELTGAHLATPCGDCHRVNGPGGPTLRFHMAEHDCVACHADDDPHAGAFAGRSCTECHGTESFRVTSFDHARAAGAACRDCHQRQDPHGAQFAEASCDRCHGTDTFRIERFDHDATRFPLDGAHAGVACAACHTAAPDETGRNVVVYRPLGRQCSDCHGGGS